MFYKLSLCTYQYFPPEGAVGLQGELDCKQIPTLDTAPKHWSGKLGTSSGISKLNYITNLMACLKDFRHNIFTER